MKLEQIHPELREAIGRFPRIPFHRRSVPALMNLLMRWRPRAKSLPGVQIADHVEGEVRVRLYRPEQGLSGAGLLWIHGGGLITGNAATNDRECAAFARELDIVIVSVEYRLAPKHPFPAALDDCYAAWQWMLSAAGELGIDPARIAISGQSAGGGLAASLALRIRDAGGLQPAAQALMCPMLDDRTGARGELDAIDHRVWNNRSNRAAWSWYLGLPSGSSEVPAHAAAARCANLGGLPPAWIGIGEVDLFLEENRRYAQRLTEARVSCVLHVAPMAPHGFEVLVPEASVTREFFRSYVAFLRGVLGCAGRSAGADERKSARIAAERVVPERGAQVIRSYGFARDILRSSSAKQAGAGAEQVDTGNPDHAPVFYLDGEAHQRKRGAIARFFTAKAVTTRHRAVMERSTEALLSELQAAGRARLDELSLRLAVAVASEIVGLTNSPQVAMASRINATLSSSVAQGWRRLSRLLQPIAARYHGINFFIRDVRPAIAARRRTRKDDIISHLLDEGYTDKAILIECMTYAAAGMVTTREFIVMAAWHLLERDALRERFLSVSEEEQLAILEEILRLEPVASMIYRRSGEAMTDAASRPVGAGTLLAIDIRAVNSDEAVAGACPHVLDPDRASRNKPSGGYLSFGYGSHRCPGWQIAMHETRVFLDRLLRVPGIRIERAPTIGWCDMLMSYELRDATVVCARN